MGYLHINNLYKDRDILLFRECYALEKIHGTSAHVAWKDEKIRYFSGGVSHENFVAVVKHQNLEQAFRDLGHPEIVVFGEAYGGKCQGMTKTYGSDLKFVAFDVKMGDFWLSVPDAHQVAKSLEFQFVHYDLISTDLAELDKTRGASSMQASRNGMGEKPREGIVLRPIEEMRKNNGERVIAKYKRDDFRETRTPRPIDQDKLQILENAEAIALEWVTDMRLTHVLDAFPMDISITGEVIKAMIADVFREGAGEIIDNKAVWAAIGKRAAQLFKQRLGDRGES